MISCRRSFPASIVAFVLLSLLAPIMASGAVLQVGTTGDASSTLGFFNYVLVADGNGVSQRATGTFSGGIPSSIQVTLPAGSGYRVRIICSDTYSIRAFGGQAKGVTVSESGPNLLLIPTSAPVVTPSAGNPSSSFAGTRFGLTFDITDKSGFFDDAGDALMWGATDATASGYVSDAFSTFSAAIAQTTVQKLGPDLYRLAFDNIPGPPSAGFANYWFYVLSPSFAPPAGSIAPTRPPSGSFSSDTNVARLAFSNPPQSVKIVAQGLPAFSTISAVADGNGFAVRASGFSPLQMGLPPGNTYRVRYYALDASGQVVSGRVENAVVSAGTTTELPATFTPWSVTPDPSSPTQVSAGQPYTLVFNVVDAGQIFEGPLDLLLGSLTGVPANKNTSGSGGVTTRTILGPDSYKITFSLLATATPETALFQIAGIPRSFQNGSPLVFYDIPDRTRGGTAFEVVTTAPTTGIDLALQNIPPGTSRVAVSIDGPSYHTRQVIANPAGGLASFRLGLPAGSGYLIRAAAAGGSNLPTPALATGAMKDVVIASGTVLPVSIVLTPPGFVAANDNPKFVAPGEPYTLQFTLTLPDGFLLDSALPISLRRSEVAVQNEANFDLSAQPTMQGAVGGVYSLTYNLKAPDLATTMVLYHQLDLSAGSLDPTGSPINIFAPNYNTSEPRVSVTVVVPQIAPLFATQPTGMNVAPGATVALFAAALGSPSPTYEWRKDGVRVSMPFNVDSFGTTLVLKNVQPADSGDYTVTATNGTGTVTSNPARVFVSTLNPFNPSRLANLSVRANAGGGAQSLIAGFVVGGDGTFGDKTLLVRAVGPSLSRFGIPGLLADPKLALFAGEAPLTSNDNWGGIAGIKSLTARVGAFDLASDTSADAALALTNLPARDYSAQITGVDSSTGAAMIEVYDGDTPFTATTPRLLNLSARMQAGANGEVIIAGFVVDGASAKTLLIRAVGPGLFQYLVPGVVSDPKIDLFSETTRIASNDNWGGPNITAIASAGTSVGAFPIGSNSKDAALLVTLPPGKYSVHVSSADGNGGVALVEIYDVF